MSTDEVKDAVREADKQAFRPFGLTKREYFAAMAMQGLLAYDEWVFDDAAKCSVAHADALLAALEARNEDR